MKREGRDLPPLVNYRECCGVAEWRIAEQPFKRTTAFVYFERWCRRCGKPADAPLQQQRLWVKNTWRTYTAT